MILQRKAVWSACLASCGMAIAAGPAWGQGSKSDSRGPLPVAVAGDQVIIQREPTHVMQPQGYRVAMWLEPIRSVTLTAPVDGIVRHTEGKSNSKIQTQSEVVRLDNTVAKLKVQAAEAAMRIALAEQKLAAEKDETEKALAQARVDVAKAETELAKFYLDQLSIRAPFAGELQRVLVTENQFVRAGEPVAIVIDSSRMRVEIPLERASASSGKSQAIKVESSEVEGKIDAVLPLSERFKVVRDLFDSVASAVVIVENADGKLKSGQSVYVPLIPRQPIAEVPTSSIKNLPDGQQRVQVVRHMVVRDVPVLVMGSVGVNRLFVSGAFAEGDEVIYESSHQLNDAFQLKPAAAPATAAGATQPGAAQSGSGSTPSSPPPTKPTVGF